tara:strand:- start:146 stop:1954 length:1809 start_codon:yes stop_codon:yes gene_type:complete
MHKIHIPVMGTGFSIDTPIRVAPFGISSVMSIMDDMLIEKVREHYCNKFNLDFTPINRWSEDSRAKRITAYINTVHEIVQIKFEIIKSLPFFESNDKEKYFKMLPNDSSLKVIYNRLLKMSPSINRENAEKSLTNQMIKGSIDVNIMVKLDRIKRDREGNILPEEFSDGKAALRGYAKSKAESSIVFSAGINQSLYSYMARFKDYYRDKSGKIKKKIIIKVSDFRSALIQGKFLAKKGLEVHEFRIESGLNCGGHVFPSNGQLLPVLLKEIHEKREQLTESFKPLIQKYYEKMGLDSPETPINHTPLITVQGGIGTSGEIERLQRDFSIDRVGVATPFLLVPEVTCVEPTTFDKLKNAEESDQYLSDVSPLGVPFNNLKNSVSEQHTLKQIEVGDPGSPCPKGFLISNTEFSEIPICTASKDYQKKKLTEISKSMIGGIEQALEKAKVTVKTCLCDHLGNGALINLGIKKEEKAPQAVCPGQNISWFSREYSLVEMMHHFYDKQKTLISKDRPHMFAKEIQMYVDYFDMLVKKSELNDRVAKTLKEFYENMKSGIEYCRTFSQKQPYASENIESIRLWAEEQKIRLDEIYYQAFGEKVCRTY